jgi:hypothetical protein
MARSGHLTQAGSRNTSRDLRLRPKRSIGSLAIRPPGWKDDGVAEQRPRTDDEAANQGAKKWQRLSTTEDIAFWLAQSERAREQ